MGKTRAAYSVPNSDLARERNGDKPSRTSRDGGLKGSCCELEFEGRLRTFVA
jgi:hypothetical protein